MVTAVKNHALHAFLLIALWILAATWSGQPVNTIILGALLLFPLGIWFAKITTTRSVIARKRLTKLTPSRQQWWGIVLGLAVGAVAGVLLYQQRTGGGETAVSNTLIRWGTIAGLIGGWLGRWLVGIWGGLSFKIPSLLYFSTWRVTSWLGLALVIALAYFFLRQYITFSPDTGEVQTAVSYTDFIIPLAILGYIGYWVSQTMNGTQQRMIKTIRGFRTSPRWFTLSTTFFGALLGAVLVIPKQAADSGILTSSTLGSIAVTSGLGWWAGKRLLRIKAKTTRTLLVWTLMFALGGIALVFNLPGETGSLPNALTAGGLVGLLVGLAQLRFHVWTWARLLGLTAVGVLAVIVSSGLSLGQLNVIAALFFGLLITLMIVNWFTGKK